MKKRMWALVLAGVLVISQCDTVVMAMDATDTPVVYQTTTATPNKTNIVATGGSVIFTVSGKVETCVVKEGDNVLEQGDNKDYTVNDMSDTTGRYIIVFPENTKTTIRTFTVNLDGIETTITQDAKVAAESVISSVAEISRTVLSDGRTEYVYNVEGTDLEEVGVALFRTVNTKFSPDQYSVKRQGTGSLQEVTVTIESWANLNPDEFEDKAGAISGTTCFYPTSSVSMLYYTASERKSVEVKKENSSETPDVPEFDAATLNVKVVDKDGNPVSGVALYLKPDDNYADLKFKSVTGEDGKVSYKCDNKNEMDDCTYTLLPTEESGYTCDSRVEIEFGLTANWDSYIATVDSEEYTGQEVVLTVAKAETPDVPEKAEITSVKASKTTVESTGDTVEFTVTGTNLDAASLEAAVAPKEGVTIGSFSGNETEQKVSITFPANTTTSDKEYKVSVNVKDETETKDVAVTVKGQEAKEAKISSVTEVSRKFLSDGRTEYVYTVKGENLEEVGVLVHKSVNSKFNTSQYTVSREGTGSTQKVTVTIEPWDKLGEPFDKEINGFVRFYPTSTGMNSLNYSEQSDIKIKKDEGAEEEPTVVTPDKTKLSASGGEIKFQVSRKVTSISVTVDGKELELDEDYEITAKWDDEVVIYIWGNNNTSARTITVTLNGTPVEIVQDGKAESKISSVNQLSRNVLEDGRTEYVYEVTGEALETVGVRVKASINETIKEDKYEVKREGTGTKQIVTVTFLPWNQLNIIDEKEQELNWEIRFYPSSDRTGSYESKAITLIKGEKPAAPDVIESITASANEVAYFKGMAEFTVKGTDLNAENLEISVEPGATVGEITGTSEELKFTVTFPTNPYTGAKDSKVSVNVRGKEDKKEVTVTVKGANAITGKEALKNPSFILDVRAESTIAATGKVAGSQTFPQFPEEDASLDEKMQAFAERYKDTTDPIYIMCNSGKVGAPRATKNLLAAGIDASRIFTILGGAGDADIKAALVKSGWMQDSVGWWYKNEDGSYPKETWKLIDGAWYYFNASGYRVSNWQSIDGKWYYFDVVTGVMAANAWVDNNQSYVSDSGVMVTGWQVINGADYFFNSSGVVVKNQWVGDYYLDEDGKMLTNAWAGVYHVGADGTYQKGWLKLDEGWYYLGTSGVVQTGWIQIGKEWYYGNPESENPGLLVENDWMTLGNARYHFYAGGAMAISWTLIDGDYYYFNESGAMVTSAWVGNYYLNEDGVMARNEWVDGGKYYVGDDGLWVPNAQK